MFYGLKLLVVCMITVPAALLAIVVGLFDSYGKRVNLITRAWSQQILAICRVTVKVKGLSQLEPGALRALSVHIQELIKSKLLSALQFMKTTDRATRRDPGRAAHGETTV